MHLDPPIVPVIPASSCSLSGPLLYRCPVVMYFDRGHPGFRNFNCTIYVDVIRVKSYVDSFIDSTCVPVGISINKLDLVPDRIVSDLVGVFRNCGGLEACSLIFFCIGLPVSPM